MQLHVEKLGQTCSAYLQLIHGRATRHGAIRPGRIPSRLADIQGYSRRLRRVHGRSSFRETKFGKFGKSRARSPSIATSIDGTASASSLELDDDSDFRAVSIY